MFGQLAKIDEEMEIQLTFLLGIYKMETFSKEELVKARKTLCSEIERLKGPSYHRSFDDSRALHIALRELPKLDELMKKFD